MYQCGWVNNLLAKTPLKLNPKEAVLSDSVVSSGSSVAGNEMPFKPAIAEQIAVAVATVSARKNTNAMTTQQ